MTMRLVNRLLQSRSPPGVGRDELYWGKISVALRCPPRKFSSSASSETEKVDQAEASGTAPDSEENSSRKSSLQTTCSHKPVMVKEVLNCLSPKPGQTFLDMTFGAGGHTKMILSHASGITVFALDRDPIAYGIAQQLSHACQGHIQPLLGRFSQLEPLLMEAGVMPDTLDGVVIDAGCSSMQLDMPWRGFALSKDGPLDMRMDKDRYPDMPTAADVVNALDQQSLASILKAYGEERHAKKIAAAVTQARSIYPIIRTQQLASIVAGAFPAAAMYARKDLLQRPAHVATKTFQALRIFVNDELNELYKGLKAAYKFLKPQGCLVAITFHSLEDRIVKRFLHGIDVSEKPNLSSRQKIRQGQRRQQEEPEISIHEHCGVNWSNIQKKVLTPDLQEIQENPRGRSAKLRAAIKL
ncbi:probable methyltransferase-like protein 15 [Callorhinchus milii]|uniref:12S rRNA N(4)-cytidine methyltransferase METTL15 n=2 Tax=Callorhinchus milii TaxID=7868 RepID=A0A4W3J853_CALMI|nr:probable methyltransferase-like protein 15 [Callorhinchus milii]|eukprot:gi/632941432/ref/XP_007885862.1/ PREDICTED: probable methyltransferase-like protein 15 [Callorhinchus milii]